MAFFDSGSAQPSTHSRPALAEFRQKVLDFHARQIWLEAHVDAAEQRTSRGLDKRRAETVRNLLRSPAIPGQAIFIQLDGSDEPVVRTGDGVAEPQNRVVEVRAVGQYEDNTHLEHRKLLCRAWLLARCIGTGANASASDCKAGLDFLVRGDDTSQDLDFRTKYLP